MFRIRIENPFLRGLVEWILVIGFALLLAFIVRTFLFRVTRVTGYSMEPSLSHGDFLILNRVPYLFNAPQAGDIVAFPYPGNESDYFIKRVIAVPGDIVNLQNGRFFINGTQLDDEFSNELVRSAFTVAFPFEVEEESFFVLGDNRNRSKDSRYPTVGNIVGNDMIGKVAVRIWPLSNVGRVD